MSTNGTNGVSLKPANEADPDYNTVFELSEILDPIFWRNINGFLEIEKLQGHREELGNGLILYKMNLDEFKMMALLVALNQVIFKVNPSEN